MDLSEGGEMTPELWTAVLAGIGTVLSALGVRSIVLKAMELWVRYHGDGRQLAEQHAARVDTLTQDDKAQLWAQLRQQEDRHDREISELRDRHDRELTEVRKELRSVQLELADAKAAAIMNESERQQAMRLYTELVQAHQRLRRDFEALQLQTAALTAENATLRRQLPAANGGPA